MTCRLIRCTNFAYINTPERSKIFRLLETIFLPRFNLSAPHYPRPADPVGTTPSNTLTPELPAWSFILLGLKIHSCCSFLFRICFRFLIMHYRMQSSKLVSVGSPPASLGNMPSFINLFFNLCSFSLVHKILQHHRGFSRHSYSPPVLLFLFVPWSRFCTYPVVYLGI